MNSIRRLFGMRMALTLLAPLLLLVAVSFTAPPANGAPAPPSASISKGVNGCDFTVTYTWSGFKGKVAPSVRLVEQTGTPLDLGIAYFDGAETSGRTGSVTHVFHLTADAHAARNVYARGSLMKGGAEVSGSRKDSSITFGSTCGDPIT